jgi:hypothetical protein
MLYIRYRAIVAGQNIIREARSIGPAVVRPGENPEVVRIHISTRYWLLKTHEVRNRQRRNPEVVEGGVDTHLWVGKLHFCVQHAGTKGWNHTIGPDPSR